MWIKYKYDRFLCVVALEAIGEFCIGPVPSRELVNGPHVFELIARHRANPEEQYWLTRGTEDYCTRILSEIIAMYDNVCEGETLYVIPDPPEVVGESAKP